MGWPGLGPGARLILSPGSQVNRHFFCRHRGTTEGSAICVFSMKDVQRAFDGFYKAVNRETLQWYTVAYEVPTPRPGSVRTARRWAGSPGVGASPRLGPLASSKPVTSVFSP